MKRQRLVLGLVFLGGTVFAAGCSSDSSGCADGGDAACTSGKDGATTEVATTDSAAEGPALYGLTGGDSCFEVIAVDPSSVSDGCMKGSILDAATPGDPLVLPFNYDSTTKIITLGTSGSLGAGTVASNVGTLNRVVDPTDSANAACMWHQTDVSQLVLTADNQFTISVTEMQSMFAAACTMTPAAGSCTSTWTWTMAKSVKTPPCM